MPEPFEHAALDHGELRPMAKQKAAFRVKLLGSIPLEKLKVPNVLERLVVNHDLHPAQTHQLDSHVDGGGKRVGDQDNVPDQSHQELPPKPIVVFIEVGSLLLVFECNGHDGENEGSEQDYEHEPQKVADEALGDARLAQLGPLKLARGQRVSADIDYDAKDELDISQNASLNDQIILIEGLGFGSSPVLVVRFRVEFAFPSVNRCTLGRHAVESTLEELCLENLMLQVYVFLLGLSNLDRWRLRLLTLHAVEHFANYLLLQLELSINQLSVKVDSPDK